MDGEDTNRFAVGGRRRRSAALAEAGAGGVRYRSATYSRNVFRIVPHQPLVAVTATTKIVGGLPRVRVNAAYTRALAAAGMIPVVVPPLDGGFAEIVARVDGLLLTGGEDVDPSRYGATRHAATEDPHGTRDSSEIALILAAHAARLPTLAICRGLQVANVALGGTLVQDIPSERPSSIGHSRSDARTQRVHEVGIAEGSLLASAIGARAITANSSHHQAVDRIASGLAVTATAPDGIIEGAEWTGDDGWWMLGVQWHPEELIDTPEPWDRALFAAFRTQLTAVPAHR